MIRGLLLGLLLALGAVFYLKNQPIPCQPPTEKMIHQHQIACAQQIFNPSFKIVICQTLGRGEDCQLSQEDKPQIDAILNKAVNDCASADLKENNLCVDNIKDIVE